MRVDDYYTPGVIAVDHDLSSGMQQVHSFGVRTVRIVVDWILLLLENMKQGSACWLSRIRPGIEKGAGRNVWCSHVGFDSLERYQFEV